ncbi:MAG: hypothetical protein JW832_04310 [Deltaproteobacteria bacterium]|nr:hypothetical protein [Deltaproteobacteria bacterium]
MDIPKALQTLRSYMHVKPTTARGDLILVGMPSGVFYGLVESIEPDGKKNWYQLKFKLLILPPVEITWILRLPQMSGDIFTINGAEHFVVAVDVLADAPAREKNAVNEGSGRPVRRTLALIKGGGAA